MMKCQTLYEEFKMFEGQPVKVYTDDEKVHCGIDMEAYETAVRILDDCNRPIFIEYSHIDAVVEPQMRLRRCCHDHCRCEEDKEFDEHEECEHGHERDCDRHGRDRDEFDCDRDRY